MHDCHSQADGTVVDAPVVRLRSGVAVDAGKTEVASPYRRAGRVRSTRRGLLVAARRVRTTRTTTPGDVGSADTPRGWHGVTTLVRGNCGADSLPCGRTRDFSSRSGGRRRTSPARRSTRASNGDGNRFRKTRRASTGCGAGGRTVAARSALRDSRYVLGKGARGRSARRDRRDVAMTGGAWAGAIGLPPRGRSSPLAATAWSRERTRARGLSHRRALGEAGQGVFRWFPT